MAVASPHLVDRVALPLAAEDLLALPLLHDAHGHWPVFLQDPGKLPGQSSTRRSLALDAAMAGQGVAITARAFVQADLKAGRLVQVAEAARRGAPDYYLVRKRGAAHGSAAEAVWHWCASHLALPGAVQTG